MVVIKSGFTAMIKLISPAAAIFVFLETTGARAGALTEISDVADQICGRSTSSNSLQTTSNTNDVAHMVGALAEKLNSLGITAKSKVAEADFDSGLEDQVLRSSRASSDCKLRVFALLVDRFILPVIEQPKKPCRVPANGVERYNRTFEVKEVSGWRKGGYDPKRWCSDARSILLSQNPGAKVTVTELPEEHRSACGIFNCTEYNYSCQAKVQADPVYNEAVSSACP